MKLFTWPTTVSSAQRDLPQRLVAQRVVEELLEVFLRHFDEVPRTSKRLPVSVEDRAQHVGLDITDLDAVGQRQVGNVLEVGADQRCFEPNGGVPGGLQPRRLIGGDEPRPRVWGERPELSIGEAVGQGPHVRLLGTDDRGEEGLAQMGRSHRREQHESAGTVVELLPTGSHVADGFAAIDFDQHDVVGRVAVREVGVPHVELLGSRHLRVAGIAVVLVEDR